MHAGLSFIHTFGQILKAVNEHCFMIGKLFYSQLRSEWGLGLELTVVLSLPLDGTIVLNLKKFAAIYSFGFRLKYFRNSFKYHHLASSKPSSEMGHKNLIHKGPPQWGSPSWPPIPAYRRAVLGRQVTSCKGSPPHSCEVFFPSDLVKSDWKR